MDDPRVRDWSDDRTGLKDLWVGNVYLRLVVSLAVAAIVFAIIVGLA